MKTQFKQYTCGVTVQTKRLVYQSSPDQMRVAPREVPVEQKEKQLQRATGKTEEQVDAYRKEHKFADIDKKLGMKLMFDSEAYDVNKLYAKLATKNEEIKKKFDAGRDSFNKALDVYLRGINIYDGRGKINLTAEQINAKGVAYASMWEDVSRQSTELTTSLDQRGFVEERMAKLEVATGSVPGDERAKRSENSINFQAQQRALLKEAQTRLGKNPVDLLVSAKEKLEMSAVKVVGAALAHRLKEINSDSASIFSRSRDDNGDYLSTKKPVSSEVTRRTIANYVCDFWDKLPPMEKQLLDDGKKRIATIPVGGHGQAEVHFYWDGRTEVWEK